MTDDELLTRLAEVPVEEWTSDEMDLLRARSRENPAVRQALTEHLLVESVLTAGLTRHRITAEQVLARVDASNRSSLSGRFARGAALLLATIGLGGGLWWYRTHERAEPAPRAAVEPAATPEQPPLAVAPQPTATPSATAATSIPAVTAISTTSASVAIPAIPTNGDKPEPWVALLARSPRPSEELWFDDRRLTRSDEGLLRWWDTVAGQQFANGRDNSSRVQMSGTFRLRAPWPSDAVLTFWPNESGYEPVHLYFWHGDRGVMLELSRRHTEQWFAYAATRRPGEPLPDSIAYASGDTDRSRRTGTGPCDLRYHDGRLYLSRGDVLLLSAPMPGTPDDVFIEGKLLLRGMGLARAADFPTRWIPEPPPTESIAEASSPLLSSLPEGVTAERIGPDGLALRAEGTKSAAWAALPIEHRGLDELYVDVESADHASGVYLGDATGKPRVAIGFLKEPRSGRLMLSFADPFNPTPRIRLDQRRVPEPCVVGGVKLRFVCGAGSVKCYASRDGLSWGRTGEPLHSVDGSFQTIGIYTGAGAGAKSIRVRSISRRTIFEYDDRIAGELPTLSDRVDDPTWLSRAMADGPSDGVRYHRLVKALSVGTDDETAKRLLVELAALPCGDLPADEPKSLEADLDYVGRLAQFVDAWDPSIAAIWAERIVQSPLFLAGRLPVEVPDPAIHAPFSSIRAALVEKTPETSGQVTMLPPDPIRREIARLILDGNWDRLAQLCRAWHAFGGRLDPNDRAAPSRPAIMTLVDWAAVQAERHRDAGDGVLPTAPQSTLPAAWRHPLIEQFGKEGYNVLAELETALEERAYDDACRIITSVTAEQAVGLLPNAHDPDLLTSLPGAVALAMHSHPELRAAMQRQFGDLATLRLRQAAADGDVAAVRALTTQFYGSSAAAEAQIWLGDRALSQGDAARAEGHYETAQREAPEAEPEAVHARLRLTAAWQGRDHGAPPTKSLRIGEATLTPIEFERIVARLSGRARSPSASSQPAAPQYPPQRVTSLPPPTAFQLKRWAALEGDLGKGSDGPPKKDVDYAALQLATAFTDDRMFVSNRFQVAAYELKDGKLAWRTGLGNEQGRPYQWPGAAMPPVVAEGRIFVRRLTAAGPELACLDAAAGRVVWRTPRGEIVASDPLVVGDRVQAVTVTVPQPEMLELAVSSFDARSGRSLGRRTIVQLRDYWRRELPCFLVRSEEMLVVSAAGCVIGCGAEGEPRWTRKLLWVPSSVDTYLGPATPVAPTVDENRVEVVQPGVPFRLVIDARTGAVVDQSIEVNDERPGPGAPRLLAPVLHSADGRTLWTAQTSFARKLQRSQLAWTTGDDVVAAAPLGPWSKQPRAWGPILAHGDRQWAFVADDPKKNSRTIFELTPDASAQSIKSSRTTITPASAWKLLSLPSSSIDVARKFPEWTLLSTRFDEKAVLDNRLFLEEDCVLTIPTGESTPCWTRVVALPDDAAKSLHLRTAAAAESGWRLVVRIGDDVVFQRDQEFRKSGSPWNDERIDLTPYRGRTAAITLVCENLSKKSKSPSPAAWQWMEIE